MAYTATNKFKSVFGNKRVECYEVTADAASGVVATGISVIEAAMIAPVSMASAGVKVGINLSAAGAASNGNVQVKAAASGDAFLLTLIGR